MTKKSRQKFKYLENERDFLDEIKNIFIIFKGVPWPSKTQVFLKGEKPTLTKRYPCKKAKS